MSLFIQNDRAGFSTGSVFPDCAFLDLLQIANMDAGIGQNAPAGDLIQITYAQTLAGTCPNRLNTLVNTDFTGVAGATDIVAIAVDNTFMLNDGSIVANFAGVTLSPHSSGGAGSAQNPTEFCLVIYDVTQNGGTGFCIKGEVSGNFDVPFPNPVILYHELSHAFRIASSAILSLAAAGCAASPEEMAAEVDENDMRDQMGIAHRDTTDHCGNPGCPSSSCGSAGPTSDGGCCIVASVATGSPFSQEVNALRAIRDKSLRWSDVGFDFFDKLHYDYYSFSPQVCTLMSGSPELRDQVSAYFVLPLTRCLYLIHDYGKGKCSTKEIGARFEAGVQASAQLSSITREEVHTALSVIGHLQDSEPVADEKLEELAKLLSERAWSSPFVHWALIETIEIYANALLWRFDGVPSHEIGSRLGERFDAWGARMPVSEVWKGLSRYAIREELDFLKNSLLRSTEARERFAQRLIDYLAADSELAAIIRSNVLN